MSNQPPDTILARLHKLEERNRRLEEGSRKLEEGNRLLLERIEALEKELSKYKTKKTSRNSSRPPSQDFGKCRRTRSLRKSKGLSPGGQLGHKGQTLECTETPDALIELKPKLCEKCGQDLEENAAQPMGRSQTIDLPQVKPIWTEHRYFKTVCSCGHCNGGSQSKTRGVVYGPRIRALVSYLSIEHYMPYSRIVEVLKETYGLRISEGSIDNILKRMGDQSTDLYDQIRQKVMKSEVVGSDETGFRVAGKLHWVWAWQSSQATYLSVHQSRGRLAVDENFPQGLKNSVLVHDRWASQINTEALDHQFCMAHILRELKYIQESEPQNQWAWGLESLIQETIHLEKELGEDWNERALMKSEAQLALMKLLNQEALGETAQRLQKSLKKHRDKLWHYLEQAEIPPTNNASERALRNIKVKQKVSTSMRTLLGAKIFCKLRSIAETCRKQKTSFFQALLLLSLQPLSG